LKDPRLQLTKREIRVVLEAWLSRRRLDAPVCFRSHTKTEVEIDGLMQMLEEAERVKNK